MKVGDFFAQLGWRSDKRSLATVTKSISKVERDTRDPKVMRVKANVDRRGFDAAIGGLTKLKGLLAGIAAFAAVRSLGRMVGEVSETADRFAKMSAAVGVSTETLQAMEFAAQSSGATLQDVQTSYQTLSAATRSATFARDIGVSAVDASGKMKGMDQLFLDVADAIAGTENETHRLSRAQLAFGDAGVRMLPLLRLGSQGVRDMRRDYHALGATISTKVAADFERYNDTLLRIRTLMSAVRNVAVEALLPALQGVASDFEDWLRANRDLLKQKIVEFINAAIAVLKSMGRILIAIAPAIELMANNFRLVIAATVALKASMLLLKIAAVQTAAAAAAAWLVAAAPFVLIGLLVAALAIAAHNLWQTFAGGELILEDLWTALVDGFVAAFEAVERFGRNVFGWLRREIDKSIENIKFFAGFFKFVATGRDFGPATAGTIAERKARLASSATSSSRVSVSAPVTVNAGAANAEEVGRIVEAKIGATIRRAAAEVGSP